MQRLSLTERLRRFRKRKSLSQDTLAQMLGVSSVTVLRWENGSAKPPVSMAERLTQLGFGRLNSSETNLDEIPRVKLRKMDAPLFGDVNDVAQAAAERTISIAGESRALKPAPYVENGPANQVPFFERLFALQESQVLKRGLNPHAMADRLSAVASVDGIVARTSQNRLESPKQNAAHWNPNYGPHGWHRYIGRFPPHLVRALLNHFQASRDTVVCDPFAGSGTTLVECRLLGIPAIGVEICPLSALMSRVKSQFPADPARLLRMARKLSLYYLDRWETFAGGREVPRLDHDSIVARPGNPLRPFPNIEKWLTPAALLGTSIVLEFAQVQEGYDCEALLLALSSRMRSIGNVDVDVARAEYSQTPRMNVDVLALVVAAISKMAAGIAESVSSHSGTIGTPDSITVHRESILAAEVPEESVDFVIASPPYGVEASSYLRAHLLSYRCLHAFLREDPYEFGNQMIGSEYVQEGAAVSPNSNAGLLSQSFREFFDKCLAGAQKKIEKRAHMMMHFFDDMGRVADRLSRWVRPGGQVAFVVGNKRVGDHLIPTDRIIAEIFAVYGLKLTDKIQHKLKCNNTNSQVPWQERVIQDEMILLFGRE